MICTMTFNPALDFIMKVSNYKEGAVNRSRGELLLPGGKGVNVSIVLGNLGVENTALGFAAGFTGDELCRRLAEYGCRADFIRLKEGVTRINVKIKAAQETEINARGPVITDSELEMLYEKLDGLKENDILVLAGSVPDTLPDTVYRDIAHRVSQRGVMTAADATGKLLTNVLEEKPFLIKPNNIELEEIAGHALSSEEEIIEAARFMRQKGAQNVMVSRGAKGALLLDEHGKVHSAPAPAGQVVNTTGSGDSAVAGFIAGFIRSGGDYEYALKLAVSAGSASAFSDYLASGEEIYRVYNENFSF